MNTKQKLKRLDAYIKEQEVLRQEAADLNAMLGVMEAEANQIEGLRGKGQRLAIGEARRGVRKWMEDLNKRLELADEERYDLVQKG